MTRLFRQDDTRETYDRVARRYAEEIAGELEDKPFDRQFLDDFARAVAGKGKVVELGSGTAHVAAYLYGQGVDISGLDLSPLMVGEATRMFPELEVIVGDMLALPFEDGTIAAVLAFYSIIHFDDDQLRTAFSEMARVLTADGLAAFAFHVGDEVVRREDWWGQTVALDMRFLQPGHVATLLGLAGFTLQSTQEREPYAPEVEYQSHRAYIVARRALA